MKAKSKLLLSACALTASLAVASTGTFAWFSANSTPKVDTFEAGVMTGGGVQVAIKKADSTYTAFGTTVTKDQVLNAIGYDASSNNIKLTALQSADGATMKAVTMALGTDANANKVIVTETDAAKNTSNGGYISFDLRFRTGKENMKLYAKPTDDLIKGPASLSPTTAQTIGVAWGSMAATDTVNANVADAARVSMVVGSDATAKVTFAKPATSSGDTKQGLDGLAWAIYKHESGWDGKTDPDAASVKQAATNTTLTASDANKVELGTLAANGGFYTLDVKVNVWLDGWDGDCFNSVMGQTLSVSLGFLGEIDAAPVA